MADTEGLKPLVNDKGDETCGNNDLGLSRPDEITRGGRSVARKTDAEATIDRKSKGPIAMRRNPLARRDGRGRRKESTANANGIAVVGRTMLK